ncbi:MAG: hypothetical protein J0H89_04255 [Rhizobiales bacterium]|nr:hypothetical protein [Hyphomicrobiales bacterium]
MGVFALRFEIHGARVMTDATLSDDRTLTIREFCLLEGISAPSYFKLRKSGNGPRELRLPGSAIVRITAKARHEWHARLEKLAASDDAGMKKERAALAARAAKAGKRGAQSPAHPSRRRRAAR